MSARMQAFFQRAQQDPSHKKKVKQAIIAADLRILIAESGKTLKEVAAIAGISAPALSNKLGGETNLTIDSITAIADAVGYDFDIVFRRKQASKLPQFWEAAPIAENIINEANGILEDVSRIRDEFTALKQTLSDLCRAQFRRAHQPVVKARSYSIGVVPANDLLLDDLLVAGL